MALDYSIFIEYGPRILLGFWLTIKIVLAAVMLALPFSLVLVFARRSNVRIFSWSSVAFIELFRNTPFIIQVFLLYYVLPFYGLRLPAEQVGIIALAAFGSAYFAEVIRAGIDAMPSGQLESARAIGMTEFQAMRYIILPQAVSVIIPALTNQMLSLVKESAILSTITVQEMTMTAIRVQGETFRPFEAFIMIALLYWLLNETVAFALRKLEKKMGKRPPPFTRQMPIDR